MFGYGPYVQESRAALSCSSSAAHSVAYRSCLARAFFNLIVRTHNPVRELPRIDLYAHSTRGFLELNCHVIMHTVGRRYGAAEKVTLARLQDYLPRTDDPGCSAGFAHGLITALGPQIQRIGPKGAAAACAHGATRYQRYSCIHGLGHAYARTYIDALLPAIASCKALGPNDAADCAQGAYMDYWMSLGGLDDTRRPSYAVSSRRIVCGQAPRSFIRACWYRAFSDHPPARAIDTAAKLLHTCHGLAGLQFSGCLAGGSLVVSSDPIRQMQVCASLPAAEAASCVRGVRVPSLALSSRRTQVSFVRRCSTFAPLAQWTCFRWLGEAMNVVTDGRFLAQGCPKLAQRNDRNACRSGARAYLGPLAPPPHTHAHTQAPSSFDAHTQITHTHNPSIISRHTPLPASPKHNPSSNQ